MENNIFKYINPNDNDLLSSMKGYDLAFLCALLNDYYLEYRSELGIDKKISIGLELEVENCKRNEIIALLYNEFSDRLWNVKSDISLTNGLEIVSPILYDTKKDWDDFYKICKIVDSRANISGNAAAHVHLGAHILGKNKEYWLNFIKLWSTYENIIFRFTNGEYLTSRRYIDKYAKPMSHEFHEIYEQYKNEDKLFVFMISKLSKCRHQAVNFKNVKLIDCENIANKNTIEFRCPNGTINPIIWQNNVNLFVNLLNYSKQSSYNKDIIDKRILLNDEKYNTLEYYDEIYLEQALELTDMIFDKNIDKINFLKQYLKSFKINEKKYDYNKKLSLTK